MNNITLGADIETFVSNGNKIVPICGTVGGTKANPKPLGIGFIQEDNVCAEFNIPVATTPTEFSDYILQMVAETRNALVPFSLEPKPCSSVTFDVLDLRSFPQALRFGCDPDINAYTFDHNPPPFNAKAPGLRSSGFHLHIGAPSLLDERFAFTYIRALDLLIGVPSLVFDPAMPRRTLYGCAGSFRFKPYGIEWRVPSGEWLNFPYLWSRMAQVAIDAIGWASNNEDILYDYQSVVQNAVDTGVVPKELLALLERVPCLNIT